MVRPDEIKTTVLLLNLFVLFFQTYIFENTNVILTTKELSDNHKIRI
jgi:hypothetical protein